jgi:hypothetical protein
MRFGSIIGLWLALSVVAAAPGNAAIYSILSYDELFAKSDLIVIAEPITATADTAERTVFPDLDEISGNGPSRPSPAIGVETVFRVCRVLKGAAGTTQFTLHHLRRVPVGANTIVLDGPPAWRFEKTEGYCEGGGYLMFLVREPDGRYAPYEGSAFASGRVIFKLSEVR